MTQPKKNDIVTVDITDFSRDGEGIGHVDAFPVFVKNAVIGDKVLAHITAVKKNLAYAYVEEILKPSPDRVESACPVSDKCGGCTLQNLDYPAQIAWKERFVLETLRRIGHFEKKALLAVSEPIVPVSDPFRYRNKAQFPAGKDASGLPVFGFYAPHSHRIVPVSDCIIGDAVNKRILAAVKDAMTISGVEAYDEETGTGYVRHVIIRQNGTGSKILVCIVVNAEEPLSRFRDVLITQFAEIDKIVSASFNYQTARSNVILGSRTECFYGKDYIEDTLSGLTFRITAGAFYQVNHEMAEHLYQTVLSCLSPEDHETVWDLYCGTGTIALTVARSFAGRVIGVEISPEAIRCAKENAKINGISNASFTDGDASRVRAGNVTELRLTEEGDILLPSPDAVIADPPRKGLDEALIHAILQAHPDRIVYVSCDPATLARDLSRLCENGYALARICPHDMFPMSVHCEVAVLLRRIEKVH